MSRARAAVFVSILVLSVVAASLVHLTSSSVRQVIPQTQTFLLTSTYTSQSSYTIATLITTETILSCSPICYQKLDTRTSYSYSFQLAMTQTVMRSYKTNYETKNIPLYESLAFSSTDLTFAGILAIVFSSAAIGLVAIAERGWRAVRQPSSGYAKRTPLILRAVVLGSVVVGIVAVLAKALAVALACLIIALVFGYVAGPDNLGLRLKTRPKHVVWHATSQRGSSSPTVVVTIAGVSVEELLDPVTGVEFGQGDEIWQCDNCSSLYHLESRNFISEQNSNRCVVCKVQNQIFRYRPGRETTRPVTHEIARRFRPEAITINNAARNVGRIALFEGRVVEVQRSKTSETYAVKFRRGRWVDVFKLVIFQQYVGNFSQGARTIKSYQGHTIRVRGLIQRHDTFGLQILVNDEDMIEVVD